MLLAVAFTLPSFAYAQEYSGLFGSVEFKMPSLKALPKWTNVLKRIEVENFIFDECDADITSCRSSSVAAWREFVRNNKGSMSRRTIQDVNTFVNQWAYVHDIQNWGKSDYWATPIEFLERSGDCEDYAILKFVALKELGVDPKDMRIAVVQDTVRQIAHAVLVVYWGEEKTPLILDSLFNAVLPDTEVLQYIPYYSVNETTRWAHAMPKVVRKPLPNQQKQEVINREQNN